jgi:hypothetical protein
MFIDTLHALNNGVLEIDLNVVGPIVPPNPNKFYLDVVGPVTPPRPN